MGMKVGDAAPDAELLDERGQSLQLASLWKSQPLALLFIRHLG